MEWQPIETAPSRMAVLTYRRAGLMAVAEYFEAEGVWCISDGGEIVNVTHWMPLPSPPESK